jgi:hypothetical protein
MTSILSAENLATKDEKGAVWDVRPFQLVSLLEMKFFFAALFYRATNELFRLERWLSAEKERRGHDSLLNKTEKEALRWFLDDLKRESERVKLEEVLHRLGRVELTTILPDFPNASSMTLGKMLHELKELRDAIDSGLLMRRFYHIPPDKVEYYHDPLFNEKPDSFITQISLTFPSAAEEFREAEMCFATGRNTACVFHLMRGIEFGLRTLARRLKVKLPRKRHIDLEDWGNLINEIEGKIAEIEKTRKRTLQREKDLMFYHGAASQFRHFKNAWRNHVMHTRASYGEDDAAKVMRHVREFMLHISTRLKE